MKKIKELYQKYKEIIHYLIFGVLTTAVNFVVYFLFTKVFQVDEIISNILAWFLSVLFAYITNRMYVFESKVTDKKGIAKEMVSFFGCRVASGVIDTGLFAIMVKLIGINDAIAKLITQVIVIVVNYILSKLIVFRNKKENKR